MIIYDTSEAEAVAAAMAAPTAAAAAVAAPTVAAEAAAMAMAATRGAQAGGSSSLAASVAYCCNVEARYLAPRVLMPCMHMNCTCT